MYEDNATLAEEIVNSIIGDKHDLMDIIEGYLNCYERFREFEQVAGPILRPICSQLRCNEDEALQKVVELQEKVGAAETLMRELENKKHWMPLIQSLRDRMVKTGDQHGVNMIDSYILSP